MKSILLIGLGNFGMMVAQQIHNLGHQVMAVDKNEDRVNEALPFVTNAMIGDSTNEGFLRSLGINNYDVCIETIGSDFQSSLETTSLLKELGGKLVVSRANREVQSKFLLRNGVDEVVNPEKQIAKWTAIRYTSNHILDYIKLDDDHAIFEVQVPREWVGKCIKEIDIRRKYHVNIMAIKAHGRMNLEVSPDDVVNEQQTLLVLGERRIALLRSGRETMESSVYENGSLRIDFAAGCAYKDGEDLKLTPIEYKLLCLLAKNTGKVLTHKYITQKVWGSAWDNHIASLRVFMATLRKKLEDGGNVSYIQTHVGIGYRMLKVDMSIK